MHALCFIYQTHTLFPPFRIVPATKPSCLKEKGKPESFLYLEDTFRFPFISLKLFCISFSVGNGVQESKEIVFKGKTDLSSCFESRRYF